MFGSICRPAYEKMSRAKRTNKSHSKLTGCRFYQFELRVGSLFTFVGEISFCHFLTICWPSNVTLIH